MINKNFFFVYPKYLLHLRKNRPMTKRLTLVLFTLLLVSCNKDYTKSLVTAESVVNSFYDSLKAKDYKSATVYFSDDFLKKTSKEKLTALLENINANYGALLSVKKLNESITFDDNKMQIHFEYEAQYETITTKQNISIVKKVDDRYFISKFEVHEN